MYISQIKELAHSLHEDMVARRRDLHRHPEPGWTEFRTAAMVAKTLTDLGFEVLVGRDVVATEAMMGVPTEAKLEQEMARAIEEGADPQWVQQMAGGHTGVVGILRFSNEGPVVGLRFDMDSNDVTEASDDSHRPVKEGFQSCHRGAMHACGHDGHTTVGLAVAEILATLYNKQKTGIGEGPSLRGTVKLVFQPAEEGVRGARAMVASGIVDDVNYMLGAHFGFKAKQTGILMTNVTGFLATGKYDVTFEGVPAHAGAAPEEGKNALLAAACATLNLHAIARHSGGASRINVGRLEGGSGRNVVGDKGYIALETRGATSEINAYMETEVKRIVAAAAMMYDVSFQIKQVGGATGGNNTPALAQHIAAIASETGEFDSIIEEPCNFNASEDFSYFMERVQAHGGQAAYVMVGAALATGHHDSRFDFDEQALDKAAILLATTAVSLLK